MSNAKFSDDEMIDIRISNKYLRLNKLFAKKSFKI